MHLLKKTGTLLVIILSVTFAVPGFPQQARVNKRKIEREHKKKEAKAQKDYEKRVKRHRDMQSKETQKRMKQTKKESRNNTPLK
jgi:hypothetical protein